MPSLVGSEMCIRDSPRRHPILGRVVSRKVSGNHRYHRHHSQLSLRRFTLRQVAFGRFGALVHLWWTEWFDTTLLWCRGARFFAPSCVAGVATSSVHKREKGGKEGRGCTQLKFRFQAVFARFHEEHFTNSSRLARQLVAETETDRLTPTANRESERGGHWRDRRNGNRQPLLIIPLTSGNMIRCSKIKL